MYNEQDHIRHQEERQDQGEIDAHENWLISEAIQEMEVDWLEKARNWWMNLTENFAL